MKLRELIGFLLLIVVLGPASPAAGQQKPFTKEQVQSLVRSQVGDEVAIPTLLQRGIDFQPADDFLRNLKEAGASDAFLRALRRVKQVLSGGEPAKKPINQVQILALLAGQVPTHRVSLLVEERGIDPSLAWMTGNSAKSDINPALEAGLNAVFIPHAHTWTLERQDIRPGQGRLLVLDRFTDLKEHF